MKASMKKFLFATSFIVLLVFSVNAQYSDKDTSNNEVLIPLGLSIDFPSGDFSSRFGTFKSLNIGFLYKNRKQFIMGIQYNYLFGAKLKDNSSFAPILTDRGDIIASSGVPGLIRFSGIAHHLKGSFGKIITLWDNNPNNGLLLLSSLGIFQHKIKIEVPENDIPQLNVNYRKGYDRLSNGLSFTQFIGYIHLAESKNDGRQVFVPTYYFGFDISNAWTKNRRDWNYDLFMKDEQLYQDRLISFKIGWIIHLNLMRKNDFHYF